MRACTIVRLAAVLSCVLTSACFGPAYPEGLFCSEAETCPPGQTCGADNKCHRGTVIVDGAAIEPPDAAVEPPDAAVEPPDAAVEPPDASSPDAGSTSRCAECSDNATCERDGDTGICVCNPGFEGDGVVCVDIDECAPKAPGHDCSPNATCTNEPGSFACACNRGFFGDGRTCRRSSSCRELLTLDPAAATGRQSIDPDDAGPIDAYEVHCDMDREGGGWTLVLVSSEDGQNTWTMADRARMTTVRTGIGSLGALGRDFKSLAYHDVPFRDLLFVHAPSDITAEYEGVGDGSQDFGTFLSSVPYPVCHSPGSTQGHEMTGGTLRADEGEAIQLCSTDLHFNLGDHDTENEVLCRNPTAGTNNTTFGPGWNIHNNDGCPFDDPAYGSLGPQEQCELCEETTGTDEFPAVGFGRAKLLNTGAPGSGENHIRMYVR